MSANIANQVSYLRTSRNFPSKDIELLCVEINKAYLDTANAVNSRTIGLFPKGINAITGEEWFISTQKQQTLRQVYTFTATGNVAHNIGYLPQMVRAFGSFTDGTNYYGAFYAGSTTIAGQVTFYVTSTNIVIGAGAGAPSITSGTIVLEWLVNP